MKICSTCVLPETFPGIRFDAEGVCQHCRTFEKIRTSLEAEKKRYRDKFAALIGKVRQGKERSYDAVMAYSGGKDSSYTLMLLKRSFGLDVLAVTVDNGFLSPQALDNIRRMTDVLGVDHIVMSPAGPALRNAFRKSIETDIYPMKALERASAICNTCMNLVKSFVLKTAVETGAPFLVYGWSPGQAPIASSVLKLNEPLVRQMQKALVNTTGSIMEDGLRPFLLRESHYRALRSGEAEREEETFLYAVHPLAFCEYREETITGEISALGWQAPRDTDSNSTNCLLNAYANKIHMERYGFHPYAFEIAGMVRDGSMTREEGLVKLAGSPDPSVIDSVRNILGTPGASPETNPR